MNYICSYCSNPYETDNKPKGKLSFCSRQCANRHNPRRKLTKRCPICLSLMRSNRKYCSKACFNSIEKPRKPKVVTASQSVKSSMRRLKAKAVTYLGSRCWTCGLKDEFCVYDFHHVDPSTKSFNVSGRTISWERLKSEVDKCALLCANCHRKVECGYITCPKTSEGGQV